ncbi:MAG: hypothetical protein JWO86_3678 [Myxococcaceae bacterium]|nr:hypothetical protein [Myxococcaceae bacterium]
MWLGADAVLGFVVMAATSTEQARLLRELADRIERGAQLLPGELADRLSAEVKRASEQERIASAVDEVIDSHEHILAELAK